MCMTLAFTLGLSQGYRQTLWMMWGELAGVTTVVSTCVLLLAWIQSLSDVYFTLLALAGAAISYGLPIGCGRNAQFDRGEAQSRLTPWALLTLGYVTAVMNPKGWGS